MKYIIHFYDPVAGRFDVSEIDQDLPEEALIQKVLADNPNILILDIKRHRIPLFSMTKKLSIKEIEEFCYFLGKSLELGIDIINTLNDYRRSNPSKRVQQIVDHIIAQLENGQSLSKAMANFSEFPHNFIALVHTYEQSGNLYEAFLIYAEYLRWLLSIRAKIKKALTYPILLIVVMSFTITVLLFFVLPKVIEVFQSLKLKELPFPTQALIFITNHKIYFLVLIVMVILGVVVYMLLRRFNEQFRFWSDHLHLRVPVFGKVIMTARLMEDFRTFAILYNAGMTLIDILQIIIDHIERNLYLRQKFVEITHYLQNGQSLSQAFETVGIFDIIVLRAIRVGEATGKLDESFSRLLEYFEEQLKDLVETLTNMIEPMLQIVLGFILGFIAAGILMPVYQIITEMS